jgi:hypothetical protein
MKKYLCIGNDTVEAEWLPRWYNVPYEECVFATKDKNKNYLFHQNQSFTLSPDPDTLIKLHIRPNKNYDIKIAKTEHLLQGD